MSLGNSPWLESTPVDIRVYQDAKFALHSTTHTAFILRLYFYGLSFSPSITL